MVEALANLCPGGRLVINTIRKEDADKDYLLNITYHDHLWMEKEIKSVANVTHQDLMEFLQIVGKFPKMPQVQPYPLEKANTALLELKRGTVHGAKVLVVDPQLLNYKR